MKFKTTRKAVVSGSTCLRSCGYCDLQFLLRNHEPIAYTCGVYGWNFDVYEIDGVTITTGYRGMPGKRLEGCREANEEARRLIANYDYEDANKRIEELLHDFIKSNR